ncbi:MAG: keto-deoxy-phosphogluconate aldolase, partial [Pseudomonadota bacterium]|nr:keto-deoxy-phosphogluconate aldolase [Pseudomonadota bacterium]
MQKKNEVLLAILEGQPVIPVLKIDRLADAVPLARALVKGGLPAIEITLRTPDAIDAIRLVSEEVPEAIVGAGTILTSKDFSYAVAAGARFIV